ncbi:DUF4062 domain-containing protein [Anoxybacterium hadale]|uniref:DUF4062 domain-containing protein n=1 Tax=Anoxybacterium hadale TaxID=3408580 RepID=A0ACD1A8B5_9FIRM|nr:DUF4062 domain-containing protein [Clostridiales bacterium]
MKKKLQVFISSTYTDMIEERQAAVEEILAKGHIPAGMELFTAGDESQLNVIKKWIDESDVYLLILGGRYGSIEPSTNKSYIQLEYEYAIKTKKPYFSIVIKDYALDEKVKKIDKSVLELDNPQKYKEFASKVKSKVCCFFEDTKDIKIAISNKLSEYEHQENITGWISGREVKSNEKYADEILKLILENKKDKEKIINLENKLAESNKKATNEKTVKTVREKFDKRVERVLGLIRAEQQDPSYDDTISWSEHDESFEMYAPDGEFSYYFVYKDTKKTDIEYVLIISIDGQSSSNVEGLLADIRLMIESHKDIGGTMTYKYVIASLQINDSLEAKCFEYFNSALAKAKVENDGLFSFEIWNDGKLSLIEEELGLKVKL